MKNNDSNNHQLPNRLVTLRWFDTGFCPDQYLADLVAQFETLSPQETQAIAQGLIKPASVINFVQGNAVDVNITSFHGLIDLDRDLYPVLTNARTRTEQVFSKAAFSLQDIGMDSGDKLFGLRAYILFVQHSWALPGSYIGLSMHLVREIASLAYWKNWALEFRLDKHGDALVMAARFPSQQDTDFVINIFRGNDSEFNPYPLVKEWLRLFRSIVHEMAELWTIRIVVNESTAEKLGCLNDGDIVVTNKQMPPYPCP